MVSFSLELQQCLLEHFISSLRSSFHWIAFSLLPRLLAPFSIIYLYTSGHFRSDQFHCGHSQWTPTSAGKLVTNFLQLYLRDLWQLSMYISNPPSTCNCIYAAVGVSINRTNEAHSKCNDVPVPLRNAPFPFGSRPLGLFRLASILMGANINDISIAFGGVQRSPGRKLYVSEWNV